MSAQSLKQIHLDWLMKMGVPPTAIINPAVMEIAYGTRGDDGYFEHSPDGQTWFVFHEENDTVYWRASTGALAHEWGAAFALGEEHINNPGFTALDGWLNVYENPLDWLRNRRQGIVVLRWEWAFERLRDVTRIAVSENLIGTYRKFMKPPHLPQLGVITETSSIRRAA